MIAAVVQMTSGTDLEPNLEQAALWVGRAADAGAELVALPEMFAAIREEGESGPNPAAQELDGPVVRRLRDLAKSHGIVLAGGSFPEKIPGDSRVYNASLLIDAQGEIRAHYRKIHLFDVDLPGSVLRESRGVAPGSEIVVAQTEHATLGLSVCYDLRFPELYRALAERGANLLLVPSAFTVPTGRDHWQVLLRARAIENQAFVVAAAQYGEHNSTRRSFGRSMIVDPWGTVLATVPDGTGFALAELDFERLERLRDQLPALKNRRLPS